jgi:large subunit ribosomal protein L18
MLTKKETRLRRARQTRAKISELKAVRLSVYRSNSISTRKSSTLRCSHVLASASTSKDVRAQGQGVRRIHGRCGKARR